MALPSLASLENWLAAELAKAKAALPVFEAAAVKDFDTAKAAVESYAGTLAAELVDVAKQLNPAELEQFAAAMLPFIQSKIVAGLAAINITGTAAQAMASAAASQLMTAIVSSVMAVVAVPK